ncbi:MAG: radical SAM protein [Planctomycetes bacterium]|nr:radical SAM protein [Planctomycetota bacterium]
MRYVYPVVSRRARGVSIGINLNTDNACNWRCVYCQVPGLVRGGAPEVDLARLEHELTTMLARARDPQWMERHVPQDARRLNDVALSGNGESTTSAQFEAVLEVMAKVLAAADLLGKLRVVLITNGSMVAHARVQRGLARLAELGGEVWFKLDAGTDEGRARLNDTSMSRERVLDALVTCAGLAPTWVQTMALDFEGPTLSGDEERSYVELLLLARERGAHLRGVLLYGFARASHQPEAARLRALEPAELQALGGRIAQATGLIVQTTP